MDPTAAVTCPVARAALIPFRRICAEAARDHLRDIDAIHDVINATPEQGRLIDTLARIKNAPCAVTITDSISVSIHAATADTVTGKNPICRITRQDSDKPTHNIKNNDAVSYQFECDQNRIRIPCSVHLSHGYITVHLDHHQQTIYRAHDCVRVIDESRTIPLFTVSLMQAPAVATSWV